MLTPTHIDHLRYNASEESKRIEAESEALFNARGVKSKMRIQAEPVMGMKYRGHRSSRKALSEEYKDEQQPYSDGSDMEDEAQPSESLSIDMDDMDSEDEESEDSSGSEDSTDANELADRFEKDLADDKDEYDTSSTQSYLYHLVGTNQAVFRSHHLDPWKVMTRRRPLPPKISVSCGIHS